MFITKDIIEINKRFDKGNVVNNSSLEFAINSINNSKDWLTQLSILIRAILIDHIFEEGNKRTALAITLAYFESRKLAYDPYKLDKLIEHIIRKNINNIEHIRGLIKNAI